MTVLYTDELCNNYFNAIAFRSCVLSIRWEGPNGLVLNERGRIRITDSTHLVINDVEATDAGEYRCVVENMATTRTGQFLLVVSGETSFF